MRTLCVIPVRGGSKGIPRKNLATLFDDMTLLEWTIRQAHAVYDTDEVIVSTEDRAMSDLASACNSQVHHRPSELAQDSSSTASVVEHLVQEQKKSGRRYDVIAILQVTSPLRDAADIRSAREIMLTGNYDSVVSAYREDLTHPAKMYFWEGAMARPVLPEMEGLRRQDLPQVFRRNGAIFMATMEHFERTGALWGGRTGLVQMPKSRSVDVDSEHDLAAAREFFAVHPDMKNAAENSQ